MELKIALAGNPNTGKTTLFNALTNGNQYVGNWPGVTVEKKDGKLAGHKDVTIQDLPGIYSLSPYTLEEVVSRNYLVNSRPDALINILDATNIERNLYLTTQLLELNIPTVLTLNMMDLIRKNGDTIDLTKLSKALGCEVMTMSALKSTGVEEVSKKAIALANTTVHYPSIFTGSLKEDLDSIATVLKGSVSEEDLQWYSIKAFERDAKAIDPLNLSAEKKEAIEKIVQAQEASAKDDSESIITNARYEYVTKLVNECVKKGSPKGEMTFSDKVDAIVTNRWLALPIFVAIMWLLYYISVTTLGTVFTDWTNDVLFGELIPPLVTGWLETAGAAEWIISLIVDGIIGGVGTVLGFVPQMMLIFLLLSILEDSGYMARVAFIMDRIFRRFGLSGKSFIPMLIGSGCAVPAIMAARTIENEQDRRMTIMLSPFVPCGAKMVIIGMITSTFFPDNSWIAPSMYFLGIAIIIFAGIALKKTKAFAGEPAPFIMELPAYHIPSFKGVMIHMWERAKAFMIKAGTIIFVACVVIWFTSNFNWSLSFTADIENSILAGIGNAFAWIFAPLGFGTWKGAVAVISAEVAKEQAISTLAVLNGVASEEEALMSAGIAGMFTTMGAFSFMTLNLFDPPCLVAIATTIREMGSKAWGWATVGFQFVVGYGISFVCYQLGTWLFYGGSFNVATGIAILVVLLTIYAIFRPAYQEKKKVSTLETA